MREKKKLVIDRIPERFNEGLFWGNGHMGALLYLEGTKMRFCMDHVQLWELRDSGRKEPRGKSQDFIQHPELFHNGTYFREERQDPQGAADPKTGSSQAACPYYRTKLPGLSLVLEFGKEIRGFYGELDLEEATSRILLTLEDGSRAELRLYLDSNVNVFRIDADLTEVEVRPEGWDFSRGNLSILQKWGYSVWEARREKELLHALQPFSENGLAVLSVRKDEAGVSVALNALWEAGSGGKRGRAEKSDLSPNALWESGTGEERDAEGLLEENRRLLKGFAGDRDAFFQRHRESWAQFWGASDLCVPNERLQQAYDVELYKIFANERADSLPVTLQGIWNNDSRMPAWCGDWHNDLNVQACYWPVYKTRHGELAAAYIDYYAAVMPQLEKRAEQLFGITDALHCPVMMAPGGHGALGEWCFWNSLLGPELFVATDFIWYYEYTRDQKRLASSIYPFLEKVAHLYQGIARKGEDGYLHIPFTNSPEVFLEGRMLIGDDATFVISALHYLLTHLIRYAEGLGKDASELVSFEKNLVPLTETARGYPLFPSQEVFESHRHFCHLYPIFPLGTDVHSECARRSLNAVIDQGFTEYASWSFPYLAIFAARCGRGNMAETLLEIYCRVFRARNTFCVNGDPNGCGLLRVAETNAGEPSDVFTLEAGFILPAALSDMFVHRSGEDVYVAYGIPDEWKTGSCEKQMIEGGHLISVTIKDYHTQTVRIQAGSRETLRFHIGKRGEREVRELMLEKGAVYELDEGTRLLKSVEKSS